MTKQEKQTMKDFFSTMIDQADSMLIITMKEGSTLYGISASPLEVAYMTDVVKGAVVYQKDSKYNDTMN